MIEHDIDPIETTINRRLDNPTNALTPAFRALAEGLADNAPTNQAELGEIENLPRDTAVISDASIRRNAPTTTPAPDTLFKKRHARDTNGLKLRYHATNNDGTAIDGNVTIYIEDIPKQPKYRRDADDSDTFHTDDNWSHLNPRYEIASARVTVTHRPLIPADERDYDRDYPQKRELNKYTFLDDSDGVSIADVDEVVEYAIAFLKTIGDPAVSAEYYEQEARAEKLASADDADTGEDGQSALTAF